MTEEKFKEGEMTEERIKEEEMGAKLEEIEKTEEFVVGGETSIEDEVIASIAGVAAREVEGVASLGTSSIRRIPAERLGGAEEKARGVEVEAGKKEIAFDSPVGTCESSLSIRSDSSSSTNSRGGCPDVPRRCSREKKHSPPV